MATSSSAAHPQVGAPDPNRETSPIVGEDDQIEVEPNAAGGGCFFNGARYALGACVLSCAEVLRCEPPGVWVREGELRPHGTVLD
ncbi:MAG TPA: hypothetical protein VLE45_02380 [Burkholderiaceae bacterium]|nr:hypothetical protein [Burkholderiaceae bacterium]